MFQGQTFPFSVQVDSKPTSAIREIRDSGLVERLEIAAVTSLSSFKTAYSSEEEWKGLKILLLVGA
jgi:hypothetical protein